MKHHFVLILVLGVLLWLMAHGRLADLIDAMEGKAGSNLDTGPAPAGGLPNTPSGSGPFGLSNIQQTTHPTAYLQEDAGLLPGVVGEVNFLLPYGTQEPVTLPGGSWTETQKTFSPTVGWEEVWSQGPGTDIGLLHLSDPGTVPIGGSVTGLIPGATTGWPLAASQGFGVGGPANAHLAVIYDAGAAHYIGG